MSPAPTDGLINPKSKNTKALSTVSLRGLLIKQEESGVDLLSHTVKCNIIGAEAFHGPVRDGKGWFHLAMDTRRKGLWLRFWLAVCVDDAAALSTLYLEEVVWL